MTSLGRRTARPEPGRRESAALGSGSIMPAVSAPRAVLCVRKVVAHTAYALAAQTLYWVAVGWRRALLRTTFIAVTGTHGKTTTKEMLATILGSSWPTFRTPEQREHRTSAHPQRPPGSPVAALRGGRDRRRRAGRDAAPRPARPARRGGDPHGVANPYEGVRGSGTARPRESRAPEGVASRRTGGDQRGRPTGGRDGGGRSRQGGAFGHVSRPSTSGPRAPHLAGRGASNSTSARGTGSLAMRGHAWWGSTGAPRQPRRWRRPELLEFPSPKRSPPLPP